MSPELRVGEFISCNAAFDVTKIENNRIYVIVVCESGIHVKCLQLADQRILDSEIEREGVLGM